MKYTQISQFSNFTTPENITSGGTRTNEGKPIVTRKTANSLPGSQQVACMKPNPFILQWLNG